MQDHFCTGLSSIFGAKENEHLKGRLYNRNQQYRCSLLQGQSGRQNWRKSRNCTTSSNRKNTPAWCTDEKGRAESDRHIVVAHGECAAIRKILRGIRHCCLARIPYESLAAWPDISAVQSVKPSHNTANGLPKLLARELPL